MILHAQLQAGRLSLSSGRDSNAKKSIKIKLDRWVSSWWLFSRPDPAHTALHPNLNHLFPRPRQLAAVTCKRKELGLEGGGGRLLWLLMGWRERHRRRGVQTGWRWWHQFWKMCVTMCLRVCVCVCSCACHILTSKIHILLANRGQFGELRTFWLVLTTVWALKQVLTARFELGFSSGQG